jgi:hypothetical protein
VRAKRRGFSRPRDKEFRQVSWPGRARRRIAGFAPPAGIAPNLAGSATGPRRLGACTIGRRRH